MEVVEAADTHVDVGVGLAIKLASNWKPWTEGGAPLRVDQICVGLSNIEEPTL